MLVFGILLHLVHLLRQHYISLVHKMPAVFIKPASEISHIRSPPFSAVSREDFLTEYDSKRVERLKMLTRGLYGLSEDATINSIPSDVYSVFDAERFAFFDASMLSSAHNSFMSYISHHKKNRFTVYCVNPENGEDMFIDLSHRFTHDYMNKVKSRMIDLQKKYSNAMAVMVTLTLDPEQYKSKWEMWTTIKKDFNRFMSDVRAYFKRKGYEMPPYLATIEAMKGREENGYIARGNPHIHVVFFGVARLMDWRRLRDYWGKGHVYVNRTPEGEKVRKPINYVTKYIIKTFTDVDGSLSLQQALVWFFSVRSYTCSRGLVRPLNAGGGSDFIAAAFASCPSSYPDDLYADAIRYYVSHHIPIT